MTQRAAPVARSGGNMRVRPRLSPRACFKRERSNIAPVMLAPLAQNFGSTDPHARAHEARVHGPSERSSEANSAPELFPGTCHPARL